MRQPAATRATPIKATATLLGALIAGEALAQSKVPPAPRATETRSRLAWAKDWKTARVTAEASHKLIMVDFWAAWCKYCEKLDQTTYVDPRVVAAISKDFVAVKVNTEGRRDETEFAEEHGVEGLPTIGFFTASGRPVARIDGYTKADDFLSMVETTRTEGEAMVAFESTLKRRPTDFLANYGLGLKLYELNYLSEARPFLEAARKSDTGGLRERKHVRLMIARIIENDVSLLDSEPLLREALALPPEGDMDPRIRFFLSRALSSTGRIDEGRAELRRIIAEYPKHPVAATAKKTLDGLK